MDRLWNDTEMWKPKYSVKTFPSDTLSTTNSTYNNDLWSNPGLCDERPGTNPLSHDVAPLIVIFLETVFLEGLLLNNYELIINLKTVNGNIDNICRWQA